MERNKKQPFDNKTLFSDSSKPITGKKAYILRVTEKDEEIGFHSASDLTFILDGGLAKHRKLIEEICQPPVDIKKGTVITSGGSPSPCGYYLLDGIVKIGFFNIHGYERILGYHKADTIFAMDSFRKDQNVIVSTTAITDISAIKISTDDLYKLFDLSPEFAVDTVLLYTDVLKLMCYDAESQSSNSVKSKLANFMTLYAKSRDYYKLGFLPFSQSELASAIGASRIQVARVCAEMKTAGLISISHRKVHILDLPAVEELASILP